MKSIIQRFHIQTEKDCVKRIVSILRELCEDLAKDKMYLKDSTFVKLKNNIIELVEDLQVFKKEKIK